MKLACECRYCAHKWEREIYMKTASTNIRCPRCNDRNVRIREISEEKVDYYEGCSAFANSEEDTKDIFWTVTD